ncbi:MAG: DM13 domain-containing protein [Planctomycetota bacterium]
MFRRLIAAIALLSLTALPAHAGPVIPDDVSVTHSGGLWVKGKNEINGHYFISERDGARTITLGSDFATKSAPDLKIILSPTAPDRLSKRNVLKGGVVLGLLASATGEQSFDIPSDVDLSEFRSVAIHCEQYNVFWGAVPLNEGRVVYAGSQWTKKSNSVTGAYEIARLPDGSHVLRTSHDFKTRSAPDLKWVLSNHSPREAKSGNALSNGRVVRPLDSAKGAQEAAIPASVDPGSYQTLLIHCEQFTKLWAAAPLEAV